MITVSVLGCGWLGKPLAVSLLKQQYLVKGSTKTPEKLKALKQLQILPFLVDISADTIPAEFLNSEVLLIMITSKSVADFKNLISQIEKSRVKKVLFISSTSVYGRINKVMTENDEVLDTPLAVIENLFRENIHFKTTIIRFAGLFGGDRHPEIGLRMAKKYRNPTVL